MRKQWRLAQKRYGSRFRRQLHFEYGDRSQLPEFFDSLSHHTYCNKRLVNGCPYFLEQYHRVFILGHVMPRDDISLTKHGLKIPVDAADYAGFVLRMNIREQECKRELTG